MAKLIKTDYPYKVRRDFVSCDCCDRGVSLDEGVMFDANTDINAYDCYEIEDFGEWLYFLIDGMLHRFNNIDFE